MEGKYFVRLCSKAVHFEVENIDELKKQFNIEDCGLCFDSHGTELLKSIQGEIEGCLNEEEFPSTLIAGYSDDGMAFFEFKSVKYDMFGNATIVYEFTNTGS